MGLYLVTGGCGFIGSHLVRRVQNLGHGVRVLDDLSTGKIENLRRGTSLVIADVADATAVEEAIQGVDGCFHLAAIPSVIASQTDWIGTHHTNLTGAITVFEKARRARQGCPVRVVYASSAAVYGDSPRLPAAEQDWARPLTAYGADKLACELHAQVAWRVHGVPTLGFRFFNVYGSGQDPKSPYSGVISIFLDRLSGGMPIEIFGDGGQRRDFVYVGDVVDFLVQGMSSDASAEVLNVCTGRSTTIRALADVIGSLYGKSPRITFRPERPGEIRTSTGDPTLARSRLGLEAKTSLPEGLIRTIEGLAPQSHSIGLSTYTAESIGGNEPQSRRSR